MSLSHINRNIIITTVLSACITMTSMADTEVTPGYNHKIPSSIMTPDKVDTSIGTLNFYDGLPSKDTSQKVLNNLDRTRAIEVFLNLIPAASLEAIHVGLKQMGITAANDILIFDQLMDSAPLFLTGNTDTVYAMAILDLKRDGSTIVEMPAGSGPGTVNDAYFRFVTDMGSVGPDKGKGGIYLILPPDYEGDLVGKIGSVPVEMKIRGEIKQVFVSKSPSYINWLALRGFLVDGKSDAASKMYRTGLKVYPLSAADNPPEMSFIDGSGKSFNTIHANNERFYQEVNDVIQREHIDFIGPQLRGLLASIGIEKGKDFNPDERMQNILVDAVAIANATARTLVFNTPIKAAYKWENSSWKTAFIGGDYRWLRDDGKGGRNLDARTYFFYAYTVNTPAMALKLVGKGSQYAITSNDSEGNYLFGEKNYKLNIPANVPAKDFWSVVVYDPQTRSELQTKQKFPSKNNKKSKLEKNADGSVDIYFGPTPPEGKENNWIQTVPEKGWFAVLRLYGPLENWFDNKWQPGEITKLK